MFITTSASWFYDLICWFDYNMYLGTYCLLMMMLCAHSLFWGGRLQIRVLLVILSHNGRGPFTGSLSSCSPVAHWLLSNRLIWLNAFQFLLLWCCICLLTMMSTHWTIPSRQTESS
jgi:hypothetical protein